MSAYEGISYPVHLRATPGRDVDGMPVDKGVMWSATVDLTGEGSGYYATGTSPQTALAALHVQLVAKSEPFPAEAELAEGDTR